MRRAYKFRLYPNQAQTLALAEYLETHRRLYNSCLAQRKVSYETEKKSVSYPEQSAWFKAQRATNPFFAKLNFSSAQATMRRLDRSYRVSRKRKGGANRRKAVRRLARRHARIRNLRREHHLSVARKLVRRYGLIVVERLAISNMVRNRRLARAISDAGWRQFRSILGHKAEEAGALVVEVEPAYSSQACSACGRVSKKPLRQRWHECVCGCSLHRDENAARVILGRGLQGRSGPGGLNLDVGPDAP